VRRRCPGSMSRQILPVGLHDRRSLDTVEPKHALMSAQGRHELKGPHEELMAAGLLAFGGLMTTGVGVSNADEILVEGNYVTEAGCLADGHTSRSTTREPGLTSPASQPKTDSGTSTSSHHT